MSKIETYIRKCDIFGYPVQLTLQNRSKFKSVGGGCISLLAIILFSLFLYQTTEELVKREK